MRKNNSKHHARPKPISTTPHHQRHPHGQRPTGTASSSSSSSTSSIDTSPVPSACRVRSTQGELVFLVRDELSLAQLAARRRKIYNTQVWRLMCVGIAWPLRSSVCWEWPGQQERGPQPPSQYEE